MAHALSTKVVGLYAVANPMLTGPLNGLENCVNRYPQAVSNFSGKIDGDYHHRVHDERAMGLIGFDEVWEKVSKILELS